jgi:predicted transcriptional regulator
MYNMNIDQIATTTTDVMNQISSYSQEDVDNYTSLMRTELDTQKKLNKALQENGYEDNIDSIHNFIERNGNNVDYQLEELTKVCDELKQVVDENNEMKSSYEDILSSEKCMNISKKLKDIKSLRMEMQDFLSKAGI